MIRRKRKNLGNALWRLLFCFYLDDTSLQVYDTTIERKLDIEKEEGYVANLAESRG